MTTIYDQNSMLLNTDGVVAGTPFKFLPVYLTVANAGTFDLPSNIVGRGTLSFYVGTAFKAVVVFNIGAASEVAILDQRCEDLLYHVQDFTSISGICLFDNGTNVQVLNNLWTGEALLVVGEIWYQ